MYSLALVNLPFSNLSLPSIALTQLQQAVDKQHRGRIASRVEYLSHDFAQYLGIDFYNFLGNTMDSLNAGLGDWFFRHAAFPEQPDNSDEYFRRYFRANTAEVTLLKQLIAEKRPSVEQYLDELITTYRLDQVQMVGFTSMFMQNTATFAMARKLKQRNPKILIVMGGANCEYPMGRVIAQCIRDIDYVFSGPALMSFPEFLGYVLDENFAGVRSIRGVFCHDGLFRTGLDTIGPDLGIDTPLELDYRPFMERIRQVFPGGQIKPVLPFETSRGCWWGERAHCTFCGLNGASMGYRAMSPDRALDLFESLFSYFPEVTRLTAVDNILPKSYLDQVIPYMETPAGMEIFYEVKADLSEEQIAALASAGVTQVQPGIEALATSTLKLMKKGTTVFQNLMFLKHCGIHGVQPHWNLLVGFPGETEEVYARYLEIIPLLAHLHPPSGVYPVRFDRYSPYHFKAENYGLDLTPLDFYPLIYPFGKEALNDFAYYFGDSNSEAEYFVNVAKWIEKLRRSVKQWQARWNQNAGLSCPKLQFSNEGGSVVDSRFGPAVEHTLSETGKEILERLSRPVRLSDLSKLFPPTTDIDMLKEVGVLREMKLLFQEEDRVFSLVLKHNRKKARSEGVQYAISETGPTSQRASDLIQLQSLNEQA